VIKDFREAAVYDAQAEVYRTDLLDRTTMRIGSEGNLETTQW